MSVVNKMLQDLETRAHPQPVNANYVPPNNTSTLWIAVALIVTAVVFAASYTVFLVKQDAASPSQNLLQEESHDVLELEKGDQYAMIEETTPSVRSTQANPTNNSVSRNLPPPDTTPQDYELTKQVESKARVNVQFAKAVSEPITKVKPELSVNPSDGVQSNLSNLRAMAHLALQQGKEKEVIQILDNITQLAPEDIKTRKQFAALLFSKNKWDEAQTVLNAGLEYFPSDSGMRLMLSRIYFKKGENTRAFDVLAAHPEQSADNQELLSFRAALAEKIGNYYQAQRDYERLLYLNPQEAKWWLGLGVSQDKQRLAAQAISSYQQAQSLNQLPKQVDSFMAQRIQLLARTL